MWKAVMDVTGSQDTKESKALILATGSTILGLVLQIVAVSTDKWLLLELPHGGVYRNASGRYTVEAYTGLWRLCRVEAERKVLQDGTVQETEHTDCVPHNLFPSEEEIKRNDNFDQHHLDFDVRDLLKIGLNGRSVPCDIKSLSKDENCIEDYTRTAIAFTIIALVIMLIGHCFAFYSLRHPRYVIKRLTALLHFMTAACLLVLNEVFVKTVEHEKENMPDRVHKEAETSHGFSFVLSWIVFVVYVVSGMVFLIYSHKRKNEYADRDDALEDEPMQLGRR